MRRFLLLSGFAALALVCAGDAALDFRHKLPTAERAAHALDRLTYGPRAGDAAEVRRLGVRRWVERQLHPEQIAEDPQLDARLSPLESLQLTPAETAKRYPSRPYVEAVTAGREPAPADPIRRALVERLARKYHLAGAKPAGQPPAALTAAQWHTLRRGTPYERRELLRALPEDELDATLVAAAPALRRQLMEAAGDEVRRKIMLLASPEAVLNYDLNTAKILRATYSRRQLAELLTDFWFNHFNVFFDKGQCRYMLASYERDAIRPNILGRFRDLLGATAHSPAMLFYLDNWQSVTPPPAAPKGRRRPVRGLNENYARELMELHTLGVDGGYTQQDVIEVARCFTGWTIKDPRQGGAFEFNAQAHDRGAKTVLGVTIPAGGGIEDGDRVLDILARHPSTARFIARKLAMGFTADVPPASLVDKMARTFTRTGGDLRAVMKTMLESGEFWSRGARLAKFKTPFELAVSAVRASGAELDQAAPLAGRIATLGQPLYRKIEPTGYALTASEWSNSASMLGRMNLALDLAAKRVAGVRLPKTETPLEISQNIMQSVERTLSEQKENPTRAQRMGLALGSPEFQRR